MNPPRRLSAGPFIVWLGRVLPLGLLVILVALIFAAPQDEWTFNRVIAVMFLVGVLGFVAWFQFKAVSSDVVDHGDHLVITVSGRTEQVPLSAISDVQYKPVMLGNVVTLYFQAAGPLGSAVSYVPAGGLRRTTQHEIDQLRRRVLQARLSGAG